MLGGTNIVEKVKTAILDTGSSFMNVPQGIFIKIVHEIGNVCTRLGSCQVLLYNDMFLVTFQGGTKISPEYINSGAGKRGKSFSRFKQSTTSEVGIFRPLTLTIDGQTITWKPE